MLRHCRASSLPGAYAFPFCLFELVSAAMRCDSMILSMSTVHPLLSTVRLTDVRRVGLRQCRDCTRDRCKQSIAATPATSYISCHCCQHHSRTTTVRPVHLRHSARRRRRPASEQRRNASRTQSRRTIRRKTAIKKTLCFLSLMSCNMLYACTLQPFHPLLQELPTARRPGTII